MDFIFSKGLDILLNTCNMNTTESYTQFADHITCASMAIEETVPVVNRRLVYI